MIGRGVWIKVGAFVLIAVLGTSYVLVHYIGLGRSLLGRQYTAYVDLPESGGLFPSASVTYRGVEVGRVGDIRLRGDGIRVALNISSGSQIPADTRAVVGNGSPLGEQFVDLRPNRDSGPYLHSGSIISAQRVTLPVSTQSLLVNLDRFVKSVPRDDLRTTISELGTMFDEAGPDLRRLLDSSHDLLAEAQTSLPQTVRLIQDAGTVLDTQNDLSSSIVAFSRNLELFSRTLRTSDPDLRAVLRNGIPASTELVGLERDIDATLPMLLGNLTSVGRVFSVRIPALRQVLIIYPYVVSTSFGLFPHNGSTRFGFPTPPVEDHQPCLKGYVKPENRRLPTVLKYPSLRWDKFCKESTKADVNVRGSRMAPQPGGGRLGDQPGYMSNAGLPGGGSGSRTATLGAAQAQQFTAPDGLDYVLGSTGGQQRVLGDRSWMSLVFGPMG